jgi:uncharacterized protein (TIGR02594 family)
MPLPVPSIPPLAPLKPLKPLKPIKPQQPIPPIGFASPHSVGGMFPPLPADKLIPGIVPSDEPIFLPPQVEPTSPEGEAQPGGPFIAARSPTKGKVVYSCADGSKMIREGGSRSWRNNNPGNIRTSSFATSQGAIGDDGSFAIFSTEKAGSNSVAALLSGKGYRDLSIANTIARYAPPNENQTNVYIDFVTSYTGLSAGRILRDCKADEIRQIAGAIKQMEGWTPGAQSNEAVPAVPSVVLKTPHKVPPSAPATVSAYEWMTIAQSEADLPLSERSQWPNSAPAGRQDNPRILRYLNSCDVMGENWATRDETDWCAAFVNWCLEQAGFAGTDHPGARSFFWNTKGHFVALAKPAFGAIAVFRDDPFYDPNWEEGTGHVGFVMSWTATSLKLLGGNQDQTVREKDFQIQRVTTNGQVVRRLEAIMMPKMN